MTEEDRERDYTDAWEQERDWHQEWKDDQMQPVQEEPSDGDWYDDDSELPTSGELLEAEAERGAFFDAGTLSSWAPF